MKNQTVNNIKLGLFVLTGLIVLVVSLYIIGINQNLFGSNFTLKARYKDISGLNPGNNVRFSGIDCGTVKSLKIINDTSIEVTMLISKRLQPFIHKNSLTEIGNEGLMGNKVINITPDNAPSPAVEDGDMLQNKQSVSTGAMIETFSHTNANVEEITDDLKITIRRLNNSKAFWNIVEDTTVSAGLKSSLKNLRKATEDANETVSDLKEIVKNIKKGEGIAGTLLVDKAANDNLKSALVNFNKTSGNAEKLTLRIDSITRELQTALLHGNGPIQTLMEDTASSTKIKNTISNVEKGSASFKDNMDALKQNRFIKKYMRKEEQQKKKLGEKQ